MDSNGAPLDYESPVTRPLGTRGARLLTAASGVLAAAPLLLLYFSRALATVFLGAPPVPSLNDPHQVHPAVTVLATLSLLSLPLYFINLVLALGLIMLFATDRSLDQRSRWLSIVPFLLSIATALILKWDPLRAMEWLLD